MSPVFHATAIDQAVMIGGTLLLATHNYLIFWYHSVGRSQPGGPVKAGSFIIIEEFDRICDAATGIKIYMSLRAVA
jgi:hypothetical protein